MTQLSKEIGIGPIVAEKTASKYLNLSPSTLEKDRQTGSLGIPYVRLGRRIGYLYADLDGWLQKHRVI